MLPWVFQAEKEGVKMERFTISIGLMEGPFGATLCVGFCKGLILLTNLKSFQVDGVYDEDYVEHGRFFGEQLKSIGVASLVDVEILNGRRIRFSTGEEVECSPISQENLIAFQEAIKSGLGEA